MKTYLVGGAVRDGLLGRPVVDRDWLIVGATETGIAGLLAQGYSQVGADFPVFLHPTSGEEYALARVERKTGVGYHGFEIIANSAVTLEQDLARRDLTINSMARELDPVTGELGELQDPFDGQIDLMDRILRHTTDAFAEDPLRVLRLARFRARYGFRIAPATIELCKQISRSGELNSLSLPRIVTELEKGLNSESPLLFMKSLYETHAVYGSSALFGAFRAELSEIQVSCCKSLLIVSPEARLAVGVALLQTTIFPYKILAERYETSKLIAAMPTRVRQCCDNLDEFLRAQRLPTNLYRVLIKAGARRQGSEFSDLCEAVKVLELCTRLQFSAKELQCGAMLLNSVQASQFPLVTGKELGDAIAERAHELLKNLIGDPIGNPMTACHAVLN